MIGARLVLPFLLRAAADPAVDEAEHSQLRSQLFYDDDVDVVVLRSAGGLASITRAGSSMSFVRMGWGLRHPTEVLECDCWMTQTRTHTQRTPGPALLMLLVRLAFVVFQPRVTHVGRSVGRTDFCCWSTERWSTWTTVNQQQQRRLFVVFRSADVLRRRSSMTSSYDQVKINRFLNDESSANINKRTSVIAAKGAKKD